MRFRVVLMFFTVDLDNDGLPVGATNQEIDAAGNSLRIYFGRLRRLILQRLYQVLCR